jgi:hypothetical protein
MSHCNYSRHVLSIGLSALATMIAAGLSSREASATTISVNTFSMTPTNDSKCGLTEALVAVNTKKAFDGCPAGTGNDTIQLQAGTYTALAGAPLTITRGVTIKGAGTDPSTNVPTQISGANLTFNDGALFLVNDSTNGQMSVTLQNLFLNNAGNPNQVTGIWGQGSTTNSTIHVLGTQIQLFSYGGIYCNSFNLDVQDSYIVDNVTPESGGGIFIDSGSRNLTIARTTIEANVSSSSSGGGIEYQGIGTSNLVNSTVASNQANFAGGVDIQGASGTFAIVGSTIGYNNCAGGPGCGGGVISFVGDGTGVFRMDWSIVSNNTDSLNAPSDWFSDGVITVSNSDIFANTGEYNDGGGNTMLMGKDPLLGVDLVRIGGVYRLPLFALDPSSPCVDPAGTVGTPGQAADERGLQRGVSHDGQSHSNLFDVGAFEFDPNTQVETLPFIKSQGTVVQLSGSSGTGYSNGRGIELQATKAGDFVTYFLPSIVIDDGTYNFIARYATGTAEGTVQLEVSSTPTFSTGSVTAVGGPVDLWSKSAGFLVKNYNVSIFLNAPTYVRFRVTGKNSKSTGFKLDLDHVNAIVR